MGRSRHALATALLVAAGGCAEVPPNPPLEHYDAGAGYQFKNLTHAGNSDSLFVILTFSGGGTRAAALAYGVLEELCATPIVWEGRRETLLDEVDVISSVSGGSFTAAYYALNRERTFGPPLPPRSQGDPRSTASGCARPSSQGHEENFETAFLKHDIQAELAGQLLSPVNWFKLASPTYDRSDLAADYYDQHLFAHATYADLIRDGRPFIIVNATDMSAGAGFPFTQERFDLLCSDLAHVPIARAVAASSAFPVALSPLTVHNYAGGCGYQRPVWIDEAMKDYPIDPARYHTAVLAQSYLEQQQAKDGAQGGPQQPERPYIHLLDGGVADNIGLRPPLDAITSNDSPWSLVNAINDGEVKKLVVIVVNARSAPEVKWDKHIEAPGLVDVLNTAAGTSIDNYSFETIDLLRQQFKESETAEAAYEGCRSLLNKQCPAAKMPNTEPPHADLYRINVEFEALQDPEERKELQNLPTTFALKSKQVDHLREVGGRLLRESDSFQKLVGSLQ